MDFVIVKLDYQFNGVATIFAEVKFIALPKKQIENSESILAHEIGHHTPHEDILLGSRKLEEAEKKVIEEQADLFAKYLLKSLYEYEKN